MKINFKKGFTIAEVVVVIGIMAIITTVVLASITSSKKQGRDQKRVAEISAVQLALEQFYARKKFYPNSLNNPDLRQFLSEVPGSVTYIPLNSINPTGTPPNTECGSYHLHTTLESKISILDSKKGFDSNSKTKCGNESGTGGLINASSTELMYDVTP